MLVERNNHGHAVLAGLNGLGLSGALLGGDDGKVGWMSSTLGKAKMYDACVDAVRSMEAVIHHRATFDQLASVDGSTLCAPEGQQDDRADAIAPGCAARLQARAGRGDDGCDAAQGIGGFGTAGYLRDEHSRYRGDDYEPPAVASMVGGKGSCRPG